MNVMADDLMVSGLGEMLFEFHVLFSAYSIHIIHTLTYY